MGALWFIKVTSGVIGHIKVVLPPKSAEHRFKSPASEAYGQSTCQRSCFFNFMRGKADMSTYFGIANSHGRVGEQAGGHIEKWLILTAYKHGDCMTLKKNAS